MHSTFPTDPFEIDRILSTIDDSAEDAAEPASLKEQEPAGGAAELSLAKPVKSIYAFPTEPLDPRFKQLDDGRLAKALSAIWQRIASHHNDDYLAMRPHVCAINIELNHRGRLAPRVRPTRKKLMSRDPRQVGNFAGDRKEAWKSRDRQVIDLHWVYCRNSATNRQFRPKRLKQEIAPLCWNETFDFELASQFACEKMYAQTKAENLRLSRFWELELSTLCTE